MALHHAHVEGLKETWDGETLILSLDFPEHEKGRLGSISPNEGMAINPDVIYGRGLLTILDAARECSDDPKWEELYHHERKYLRAIQAFAREE